MVNVELAMMVLEGLAKSPIGLRISGSEVILEGDRLAMRELARLLLLLGADTSEPEDGFELKPGMHATAGSPTLRLQLRPGA
ncbi:MAG: hypothetical protein HYU52_17525 [Acidobacteria bacterium]|nr:hypothetical protein [Acidobacteriota bacterium]